METVRSLTIPGGTPDISFTFSPDAGDYVYTVGATVYSPTNAKIINIDTAITFTASATFPDPVTQWAVSYKWKFGDGMVGFGNPASHTFTVEVDSLQVVLIVKDNSGNRWRARRELYLALPGVEPPELFPFTGIVM